MDFLWIFCGLVDVIHQMGGYSVDFLWVGGFHPLNVWIFCGFSVDFHKKERKKRKMAGSGKYPQKFCGNSVW